jgi:Replication-relaxation
MILTARQEKILLSLKKLDYLDRSQLQRLHNLGGVRNANKVLRSLAPWVHSYREGYDTIYYLNALGRDAVGSQKVLKKTQFVNHVIMRNEFYIYAGRPTDWKAEVKIKDGQLTVICDAMFKGRNKYHFLEVDCTQKMVQNKVKAQSYHEMYLRKNIEKKLSHFPPLIWLTTSHVRKKQLEKLCEGMPCHVYLLTEIQ